MHPLGVGAAALVLGFVSAGGLAVQDLVPKELIEMLPGVVVLAAAAAGPWVRRLEAA
jgi:simple sugar transport system permease protein